MPTRLKPTDVVIVGLGCAGGLAAMPLAQAGIEVVGLEAGPRLRSRDFAADEVRGRSATGWASPKANHEVPTRRLSAAVEATRPLGAVAPDDERRRRHDDPLERPELALAPVELQGAERGDPQVRRGLDPAGSTVADWPLDYDDLEPYYDKVEYLHGVSGKAGNIGGIIDPRGNVFEGRAPARVPAAAAARDRADAADLGRRQAARAGTRSAARRASARSRTRGCPRASTTASARATAATSTRRPARSSTASPRPSRRATSRS